MLKTIFSDLFIAYLLFVFSRGGTPLILPNQMLISKTPKNVYMIRISFPGVCGGNDIRFPGFKEIRLLAEKMTIY
jgi:hypothetical protein